ALADEGAGDEIADLGGDVTGGGGGDLGGVGAAPRTDDGGGDDEAVDLRVAFDEAQVGVDGRAHARAGIGVQSREAAPGLLRGPAPEHTADVAEDEVVDMGGDRPVQARPVGEVPVEDRLGGPGGSGELVHAH